MAEPQETAPATPEAADEPASGATGLLSALRETSPIRVVMGVFGLVGMLLGGLIAWRSESATTLLVVSAVLLVLSALGLDWNKIRGTYGGWTIEVLRGLEARIAWTPLRPPQECRSRCVKTSRSSAPK